jgi:hypothetical protein
MIILKYLAIKIEFLRLCCILVNVMRKYTSKIKSTLINFFKFDHVIREQINIFEMEKAALGSSCSLVDINPNSQINIIISLTTYSIRIHDVHLVIESLGRQTIKANKIILWLDQDEFNIGNIPELLKFQIKRGLDVEFCSNYKSFKKLIPTLRLNYNSNIITVDDDVIYPSDFVEVLVAESNSYPNTVICNHAHKIRFRVDGNLESYKHWELSTKSSISSFSIFPVGAGGVYYPVGCFDPRVDNESLFLSLVPTADDVWFKVMTTVNNIKSKKVNDNRVYSERFIPITRGQSIALFYDNLGGGENDNQISKVLTELEIDINLFI